jgi:Protein of unknown function (DUF1353)
MLKLDRRQACTLLALFQLFVPTIVAAQVSDKVTFMKAAVSDLEQERERVGAAGTAKPEDRVRYFLETPRIAPFLDWDWYYIETTLKWRSNTDESMVIEVPPGFVSDLASVPQLFWSILPRTGRYALAAIVHDYLYWDQSLPRSEADNIFKVAMQDLKVPTATVLTMYDAVRLGGRSAWDTNKSAKRSGEKRVLKEYPTSPLISWSEWRLRPGIFAD